VVFYVPVKILLILFVVLLNSNASVASSSSDVFLSNKELSALNETKKPYVSWHKSRWWIDGYHSSRRKGWVNKNKDKDLSLLIAPPKCPTSSRIFFGKDGYANKEHTKHRAEMREKLSGFPEETIKYCSTRTFAFYQGSLTNHPINKRHVHRDVATVIIRDLETDNVAVLRAIQENDYTSKKTGGKFFNETLSKICDFKFLKDDKAVIKCKHFGTFPAVFTITNLFKGTYKLFGKNAKFAFFITNLNKTRTLQKYKSLLKKKGEKKCSFNCK
jgi:hypothetical protein